MKEKMKEALEEAYYLGKKHYSDSILSTIDKLGSQINHFSGEEKYNFLVDFLKGAAKNIHIKKEI